jgi:hypothetical protein
MPSALSSTEPPASPLLRDRKPTASPLGTVAVVTPTTASSPNHGADYQLESVASIRWFRTPVGRLEPL